MLQNLGSFVIFPADFLDSVA